MTLDCFCGIYYSMSRHHEGQSPQNRLEPVAPYPATPEPTETFYSGDVEIDPNDPRFDLLAQLARTTFPELEDMSPDDKVRLLFGGVGWRVLDPNNEVPEPKKEAITNWSANALVDVLPEGVLRDETKLADTMAQSHPVLHEERRSHTEQGRIDKLTGLGSDLAFTNYSKSLEVVSEERPQPLIADKVLCFFDFNGMKRANDAFGDDIGDYLLQLGTNVFFRAQDELFSPEDMKDGGEKGPKVFRISGGADDIVALVPREKAREYVRFIQEEFGKMTGAEKDFKQRSEDDKPTELIPPTNLSVSHNYEANDEFGPSNVIGSLKLEQDGKTVTASLSVGTASIEDIPKPLDQNYKGLVKSLRTTAFKRMKENKTKIKDSFPHLSFRED